MFSKLQRLRKQILALFDELQREATRLEGARKRGRTRRNVPARSLQTYQDAIECRALHDRGVTMVEIANVKNLKGHSHVSNLLRCLELPRPIVNDWQEGHPRATLDNLIELCALKGLRAKMAGQTQLGRWREMKRSRPV